MKKKLIGLLSSFVLIFVSAFVPIATKGFFGNKANAFVTSDTAFVRVKELWNGEAFNENRVNRLLKLISGDESASTENMTTIYTQAESKRDSYAMRSTKVLEKTTSQDIVVTIGGLDWTPTYLSTTKDGKPILTFWLATAEQLSGKTYDLENVFNSNGAAPYGVFNSTNNPSADYPDTMYGVSYMRSVVLNNGGFYITSSGGATTAEHDKNENNAFANFTMPKISGIADCIVTPSEVEWQEKGQSAPVHGWSYNSSGENWSKDTPDDGFYPGMNFASKDKSDAWKDDLLWLPSFSELGFDSSSGAVAGIWETSIYQRRCPTWNYTRSTYETNAGYVVVVRENNPASYTQIQGSYCVRPAFHLDLNKMLENIMGDFIIDDLWDSNNNQINNDNINSLYNLIASKDNASYEDVLQLAQEKKTAIDLQEITYNGKKGFQNIKIILGGVEWTTTYLSTDKNGNAILTLWMDDVEMNRTSSWNYGGGYSGKVVNYMDNMYGSSYIRSVVLNNEGIYANSINGETLKYYTPTLENDYALFTMKQNDFGNNLVDYLVTPKDVSWQEELHDKAIINMTYQASNEAWSKNVSNTGFYSNSSNYNYAKKIDGDAWKDDYLWLPSLMETGYNSTYNGIWQTTITQREKAINSWTRSAHVNTLSFVYKYADEGFSYDAVSNSYYVKPALHLNLNVNNIEEPTTPEKQDNYVNVNELWDNETKVMNKENLETLLKYLTGNTMGYSDLSKIARETRNASDFRDVVYGEKKESQDIKISLGGLEWTATYLSSDKSGNAILTLWLADDYQSAWEDSNYSVYYSNGQDDGLSGFINNGSLKSRYAIWNLLGSNPADYKYYDSIYGTSYLRAEILNNGGVYSSTINLGNYTVPKNENIFAPFTISIDGKYNDITDFLVTPSRMLWQENQKYFDIFGEGNNLSNEAWSENTEDTNFVSGTNFAKKTGYSVWRNDYLWMPSYSEILTINDKTLWGVSENQLESYSDEYYLRSYSNVASSVYVYDHILKEAYSAGVGAMAGIRPAMHLNLTAIVESLTGGDEADGSTIYLDTENGNDYNDGTSFLKPVKTLAKAEELVSLNGFVEVMNKLTILEDTTIGRNKSFTLRRWVGGEFVAGYWETLIEVGAKNSTGENKQANLILNVTVDGNFAENTSIIEPVDYNTIGIDIIYGSINFGKNSGIINFDSKIYNHIVYLRDNDNSVIISGENFIAKANKVSSVIFADNSQSSIIISAGTFKDNIAQTENSEFGSLIIGGNVKINNANFENNNINNPTENLSGYYASIVNIYENGNLTIENSLFTNNTGKLGGVIYLASGAEIEIKNSTFTGNTSIAGGVIYLVNNNTLNILDSEFLGNTSNAGGVIFGVDNNLIEIKSSLFNNNIANGTYLVGEGENATAYVGGGVILLKSNNVVTIKESDFNNNKSETGKGGAINIDGNSNNINISNSNFNNNIASESAGSIYVNASDSNSQITIKKCNFLNSSALISGGAIYFAGSIDAKVYDSYFKNNSVTGQNNSYGGAIRGGKIYNSIFEDNSSSYFGGATYQSSAYNCTFNSNSAYAGGAMYEGEILNSIFVGNTAVQYGGAVVNPESVINCKFSNNKAGNQAESSSSGLGGAIYISNNSKDITSSIFTGNSSTSFGGAIYFENTTGNLETLIINNCEFTFNYGLRGAAIYGIGKIKLELLGEVTITNNVTRAFGALYFEGSKNNTGAELVFGSASSVDNIYIFKNYKGDNIENFEKDNNGNLIGEINNNLYVNFENGGDVKVLLNSNLVLGSKIGVVTASFINMLRLKQGTDDEYHFITYLTNDDILTQPTKNAFVSDDYSNAVFYSETIYQDTTKTGLAIYFKVTSSTSSKIVYTASDYYGVYDGNTHGVDIKVFVPTSNYTIWYSTEENGEYTKEPITVRDAGDNLTVWFYIEAEGYTATKKDKRNISIDKMNIYYTTSDIEINLWFGQVINSKSSNGTNISKFVNTTIIDEDGNAVACDFILYGGTSTVTIGLNNYSTLIELDIIPKNTEKYKSITGITVSPTVLYDNLYFNDSNFYPNEEEMNNASSIYALNMSNYNLSTMVSFLKENGKIYFASSYNVTSTLSVSLNNRVEFRRFSTFRGGIFDINQSGKLKIEVLYGKLTISGEEDETLNETSTAMIVNAGTLELLGEIYFNGCYNFNSASNGGAISSTGTLNLEGVDIRNCISANYGGGIYSTGKTNLFNCNIEDCSAVYGGGVYVSGEVTIFDCEISSNYGLNSSSADETVVRGAGLYISNKDSIVLIENSKINNNSFNFITKDCYGGGVYIESGNVEFINCEVSYNSSYYGGGLFIATSSTVEGYNLSIEYNTLCNGTSTNLNQGAGVYIQISATFNLVSGFIRSNGSVKGATTHYITGLGVYCLGTFNFATIGDTTSQITLNSDTSISSSNFGMGIHSASANSKVNIYGGNVGHNFNVSYDCIAIFGTIGVGGTAQITSRICLIDNNAQLVVLSDWSKVNDPANKNQNILLYIASNRSTIINSVFVRADENYIPTWEEWSYVFNKITQGKISSGNVTGTNTLSYDAEKNEYIIFFKTAQEGGKGTYYLNPTGGNDLNAGTATGTAWKTWNAVMEKSKPGDTIILTTKWTISDDMDIDGEGRVLKRYNTSGFDMITLSGTYVPVINITNLIIDGNKRKNDTIAEGSWSSYLNGYVLNVTVSCSVNLKNVTIRNNANGASAIYFHGSSKVMSFTAIDCNFINNTKYSNYSYPSVLLVNNSNTDFDMYLFNCNFNDNESIATNWHYHMPVIYIDGSSSTSKRSNYVIKKCKFDNNVSHSNYASYDGYSKLMFFYFSDYGASETINVEIDGCDFTNNKNTAALSAAKNDEGVGIEFYSTGAAKVNYSYTNNNFSNNFNYNAALFTRIASRESNVNFDNNIFKDNQYFSVSLFFYYNYCDVNINNCYISQFDAVYSIYFYSCTNSNINITDCSFYNTKNGIYITGGGNNVTVSDILYKGNGYGSSFMNSSITGSLLLQNFEVYNSEYGLYPGVVAGDIIVRNIYGEHCYYGLGNFGATSNDAYIENVTLKYCKNYGIYSAPAWSKQQRTIYAKDVYISGNYESSYGLIHLANTDFIGENIVVENGYMGAKLYGSNISGVSISDCLYGMYVYDVQYKDSYIENVTINNMKYNGIGIAKSSNASRYITLKNVRVSNCRDTAFVDISNPYGRGLYVEDCIFENCYYGYYQDINGTSITNNLEVSTFVNVIFRNNMYDGFYANIGVNGNVAGDITYNFENCLFTNNGRYGLYLYRKSSYGSFPKFNFDENTIITKNKIGMIVSGTGGAESQAWFTLNGSKIINNYSHGIYSSYFITIDASQRQVVVKDNGREILGEDENGETIYGKQIFNDIYARNCYLKGELDLGTIANNPSSYFVYLTGSIEGSNTITIAIISGGAVNNVVVAGSGYTPTSEDLAKFVSPNWNLEVSDNKLILSSVKPSIEVGDNIFYFNPERTRDGEGKTPDDPITNWDKLLSVIDENSIVYVMSSYTLDRNIDGKNAIYRFYIDPTLATPAYTIKDSMFKVVTGSFTISNMRIDGNSNINGYLSSIYGGMTSGVTTALNHNKDGSVANISGNSTLIVRNIQVYNLYTKKVIYTLTGSNKVRVYDSTFKNIYASDGIIYSEGDSVIAVNCIFDNSYYAAIYCKHNDNLVMTVTGCNFNQMQYGIFFSGKTIKLESCNFTYVYGYCIYVETATDSSSFIKNVYAKDVSYTSYFIYLGGVKAASYLTVTDVEVNHCISTAIFFANNTNMKTFKGTNINIYNSYTPVNFNDYANITLTNCTFYNNICSIGQGSTKTIKSLVITLNNCKIINNEYGFYLMYSLNASMKVDIIINNCIFEDNYHYAVHFYSSNYSTQKRNTLSITDSDIINNGGGLYLAGTKLDLTRSKIMGCANECAIYLNVYSGCEVNIEYCEISNNMQRKQAIIVADSLYSTYWGYNFYVRYSHFSNNPYGSLYCASPYPYLHVYDCVFDKTSGSSYADYRYCSISWTSTSTYVYLGSHVIIEDGIYVKPGSYNMACVEANLKPGSFIRLFLNKATPSDNQAVARVFSAANGQYFHIDGYDKVVSGEYLRVKYVYSDKPQDGNVPGNGVTALYFNPVSGNDNNHGHSYEYPVKTWQRVEELNAIHNVPIYLMSRWMFDSDMVIDGHGWTLLRYYDEDAPATGNPYIGNMIYISSNSDVTIKNLIIDGNLYRHSKGDMAVNNGLLSSQGTIITVLAGSYLNLQNCDIQNFIYNKSYPFLLQGNFRVENCNFSVIYMRTSAYNFMFYSTGSTDREISFINCSFFDCNFGDNLTNGKLIYIIGENVTLNIQDCYMENISLYKSAGDGALICVTATNSTLNITTLRTWHNTYNNFEVANIIRVDSASCKVTIDDCTFVEDSFYSMNYKKVDIGGAIYIVTDEKVKITNCLFENYRASCGSGIYYKTATEEAIPDITLSNLIFKNCFTTEANAQGGAIYLESLTNGGILNIENIECYYVHTSLSAIYIAMNNAQITLRNILIDGANYTQFDTKNNANGIVLVGSGDSNIVIDKLTIRNCVENNKDSSMLNINITGENESATKISNLVMENNNSINALTNIAGTSLEVTDSSFGGNNAESLLGLGVNRKVVISNVTYKHNRSGFAISGNTSKESIYEIDNITISENTSSSGLRFVGTSSNGSAGNKVFLDNIKISNNTNLQFGMYLEGVNVSLRNSNILNNSYLVSNIVSINSNLNINHSDINYNSLLSESNEIGEEVFISRGVEMFVEMPNDKIYSSGAISSVGGKVNLDYVNVIGNSAVSYGGGIVSVSPIVITNSNIVSNFAGTFGGGLVITMDADIRNSNISNNFAGTNGGGIWFGALLTIYNVSLNGNTSVNDGSSLYSLSSVSSLDMQNSNISNNTSFGDGGIYFVNEHGTVNLHNVKFIGNTGYGKGAALYLNSLIFNESSLVFSGNQIYGTLINFENVANFVLSDFVVSGNYGYGENATLFSFTTAKGNNNRMVFSDGRIYGNKMENNASIIIDDGLYIRMTNVEVTGNSNLYSSTDLTSDNGKGGAIYVKNGTLVLEEGLAVDNWAEYGAWLYVGALGKAIVSNQEISNITTDAETIINGVIYVEKNGELELHGCKILGISLSTLKGAINNNGHTKIVDSEIYDNNTVNSIIYNGETGAINLTDTYIHSNITTDGGAIYNLGAINFVSGEIHSNKATKGGAIYNLGDFSLSGGKISNNTASQGGAIYNSGKVIINSGSITANTTSVSGAGIYNSVEATITMLGGEISLNSKTSSASNIIGSGIANFGTIYMYGGSISSNGSEETGNGGGLYAGADSYNHIEGATFGKNIASATSGGANIYLDTNAYLLIKNSNIISGRGSSSNSIMDINANNATIILDNVSINGEASSGILRTEESDVIIKNLFVSNLQTSESGASFYFSGGKLQIKDSTFEGMSASTDSVLHLDNVISFEIINSNFADNRTRAIYLDVNKVASLGNIEGTTFANNTSSDNGAAIYITGSNANKVNAEINIQTSTFTGNTSQKFGGAIYVGSALGAVISIYDTIFGGFVDSNGNGYYDAGETILGNYSTSGGGAIYMEESNPASIILKGEVVIIYNSTGALSGGGFYYAFSGNLDYDNNIFGLSIQSGASVTIQNNFANTSSVTEITRATENNLYLTSASNKGILVAEVSSSSFIGITLENASEGAIVVTSYKNDIPVTTNDLQVFSYDDSYTYSLKLDANKNALVLVEGPDNSTSLIVQVSDKVFTIGGDEKTLTRDDFTVYNCRDYSILYSTEENGEYTSVAPSYTLKGLYTIWYKVVDNTNEERFVKGSVNIKITGKILSIVEAPTAFINFGEKLSQARFEFGIVKSGDAFVSGTWAFNDGNVVPNNINTRFALTFTPNDASLYENTVTILVSPTIAYDKVYYYENGFYNDVAHTSYTDINSLSEMVGYLKEMGEIFFMSTYVVGANGILEEIISTNKKIYFSRYVSFTSDPMFNIPNDVNTLKLTIGGGIGSIYIDCGRGSASSTETEPLFVNSGILTLGENVFIRNISNTGGGPAVAHNTLSGTLYLNGCDIYSTFVDVNSAVLCGGSIYNEGTMVINGGDYRLNYCTNGNGGFIYNTGSLTINSGLFARNYSTNGSGGCIYTKGGSVTFNGGDFIGNRAVYGGVICVDAEGQVVVNGANFYSNVAINEGASIYIVDGNVIQNGGDFKYNVNLSQKPDNNSNNDNKSRDNSLIIISILLCFALIISLGIFLVRKKLNAKSNK